MKKKRFTYGEEELKKQGIEMLTEQLDSELEKKENILDRKIQINKTDEYLEMELTYEVLEEIGTKEKIGY